MLAWLLGKKEGWREEPELELEPRPSSTEPQQANDFTAAQKFSPTTRCNEEPEEKDDAWMNARNSIEANFDLTSSQKSVALSQSSSAEEQLCHLKGRASDAAGYMKQILEVSADEGVSITQKLMIHKAAAHAALGILQDSAVAEIDTSKPHDLIVKGLASESDGKGATGHFVTSVEPHYAHRTGLTPDEFMKKTLSRTSNVLNSTAGRTLQVVVSPAQRGQESQDGAGRTRRPPMPPTQFVDFSSLCSSRSGSSLEHNAQHLDADVDCLDMDADSSDCASEGVPLDEQSTRLPQSRLLSSNERSSSSLSYTTQTQSTASLARHKQSATSLSEGVSTLHRYYSARLSDLSGTHQSDLSDTLSSGGILEAMQSEFKMVPFESTPWTQSSTSTTLTSRAPSDASVKRSASWSMRARYVAQAQSTSASSKSMSYAHF